MKLRLIPRTAHNQILAIGLMFLVLGAGVFALAMSQLDGIRGDLRDARGRLAPAVEHLTIADIQFSAAHESFIDLLESTDPQEQGTLLALTTERQQTATDAWNSFVRYADQLPGTRELVEAIEYDLGVLNEEAIELLNTKSPEAAARFESVHGRLGTEIDELLGQVTTEGRELITDTTSDTESTFDSLLLVSIIAFVVIIVTTGVAVDLTRRRERREAARDAERQAQAARDELDTRLQRALEVAPSEAATFSVIQAAMRRSIPVIPADVLIAESPRSHLRRVACTDDGTITCGVTSPNACPATRRGTTTVFSGHDALDTCPVRDAQGLPLMSTTCVPVNVSGHASGVVCATTPIDTEMAPTDVASVELIARKAGERLTMMRAFARSENLAGTDPLTGLFNRRTVEDQVHDLEQQGRTYVVAFLDLDHFKLVNDVYGHDAGDRALRIFARVLRDVVRPSDVPSRFGGEEFVLLLPDCTVPEAVTVLERLRSQLAVALDRTDVPIFTFSAGISRLDRGRHFDAVLAEADAALLTAKATGRDRTVVADESSTSTGSGDSVLQP